MKNLLTTVFAILSVIAFGQTPNYASYNWQRGQTFQDTVRFNDTIFTANDGNSTQWDSAYSQVQNNYANWDSAYAHKVNSISFNTGDGVLTLTQQDAGTVTADLDGRYLTSYTETDPIFTASTAFGISDADTTNWDSAYTAAKQAINTLSSINPNSQPVASQFFARARDSIAVGRQGAYVQYFNQVNSDLGRLMNQTLSSGRTAYQDATIVYSPAFADSLSTSSIKPLDGSADFSFSRASSATYVDESGTITTATDNIARFDFSQDATEPALLLEPARTNLLTYSEQFDNAAWTKTTASITADATNAPDGTATADQVDKSASGGRLQQTVTFAGTTSFSVYAKAGTLDWIRLGRDAAEATYFDLVNGVVGTMGATSASIESLANGWYRCTIVFSFTGSNNVRIYPADGDGDVSGTSGNIFIWGAQLEAGAYPTSYIPTVASTVTRSAETLSKTGLASLLGDSEGTLYFEGLKFDVGATSMFVSLSDGTLNNRVAFGQNTSQTSVTLSITLGGVSQVLTSGGSWVDGQSMKIAIKYSANDFALWVNGVEVATDNSGSTFGAGVLTQIQFNAGNGSIVPFYGNVKALAVWETALTDDELAALTTP